MPSMTSPGPMSRRAAHCVQSVTRPPATMLASRSAMGGECGSAMSSARPVSGPMPDGGPEPHPDLAPLLFLLGRWEGAGVGGYPTIESFRFGQEITFSHNGKPFLIYTSRSWLLDDEGVPGRPLGMETGFWRPQPEGKVEVL